MCAAGCNSLIRHPMLSYHCKIVVVRAEEAIILVEPSKLRHTDKVLCTNILSNTDQGSVVQIIVNLTTYLVKDSLSFEQPDPV